MTEDEIGRQVVDVAVRVHQEVGPGLLETVYEVILAPCRQAAWLFAEFQRSAYETGDYPYRQWTSRREQLIPWRSWRLGEIISSRIRASHPMLGVSS